ncbi:hypothetical protein CLCR_07949 [Cladophialophora carrionii]|uniref:Protein kinase domain-containing protein n=1 Tax=Cladophialophora carrionii TaxID=86049 RepID=A0A1C1CRW7_9EURO|nr:hypothetical protein CLCR_07949 [Cladophialophora carrionii]
MTSVAPGPDPLDEFKQELEKWKVTAVCKRQYIQVQKLKRWMMEGQPTNIDRLLFACGGRKKSFSLVSNKITEGPRKCLLVFGILLELDSGALIEDLRSNEVNDNRLPIPLAVLERHTAFRQYPELLRRFEKAQWKYCALAFELNEPQSLTADHIVPICFKQQISEGGTARIYEITVQEEFVTEALAKAVPRSRFDDPDYGPCHIFALKTYKDGNEGLYENERNAFRGLSKNKGMIKYLFDYSQVGARPSVNESANETFHLVLELGELDLDQYFHFYLPPVLVEEQFHFWSHVFFVADAIRDIHAFYHVGNLGPEKYFGWHNDIKPQNILYVQGEFKLADPGFARFEKQDLEGKDATDYMGGTSTFGAPECYILEHQKRRGKRSSLIPRSNDIWSLGCVLSIAATWSVYGTSGLEQFAELRRQAIKHVIDDRAFSEQLEISLEAGDFFHDGQKVLEAVRHWHSFLRQGLRKSDKITEKVLELIENAMLVSEPAHRISAQKLCDELHMIKENAASLAVDAAVADCVRDAIQNTQVRWEKSLVEASQSRARESRASVDSRPGVELRAQSPPGARGVTSQLMQTRLSHQSKAVGHTPQSFIITSRGLMPGTANDARLAARAASPRRSSSAGYLDVVQEEEQYSQSREDVSTTPSSVLLTPPQRGFTTSSMRSRSSTFSTMIASKLWRKETPRGDPELRHYFEDRDILFLVDNGASMAEHWEHVKIKLGQLVKYAGNIDKDGMELKFTVSSTKFKATNKVLSFEKELDNEKHTPGQRAETNMSVVLGSILSKYLETVAPSKKSMPRKMTIIVLTDGKWKDMKNSLAVDDKIVEFSEHLRKLRPNTLEEDERRLSIQFVQFGNDAQATHRLRRLDDHLQFRGVPDIVDHKRADAEPFDILAGSVSPAADGFATDEVSPEMSTSPEGMEVHGEGGDFSLGSPRRHSRSTGDRFQMSRQPSAMELPVSFEQSRPKPQRNPRSSESRRSHNSQDPARPPPPAFSFIGH